MVQRIVREEIKVDRFTMPEAQCQGRTTIKNEALGDVSELWPEGSLGGRKDVESRQKVRHGSGRSGRGGGRRPKKRCQKFQDFGSITPGGACSSASSNAGSPIVRRTVVTS